MKRPLQGGGAALLSVMGYWLSGFIFFNSFLLHNIVSFNTF